jgi:type II secretory pathway component PulK
MTARANGYVSLIVAATVAVLALAVLIAARVQSDLGPSLRRLQEEVSLETVAQTAEARVAFLMVTEPVGAAAIEVGGDRNAPQDAMVDADLRTASGGRIAPVRLDGRPYAVRIGAVRALVSIQDEAGLLNLNAPDEQTTRALLDSVGAPESVQLAAALADFVDEDDLRRESGAEAAAYGRQGLPAPPNALIPTQWRALDALGWRSGLDGARRARFFALSAALDPGQALNVNTAPAPVLAARLQLDARALRALLASRENAPLRAQDEIEAVTGAQTRADGSPLGTAPGTRFRLTMRFLSDNGASRASYESQLVVADSASEQPVYWRGGAVRRDIRGAVSRGDRNGVELLPAGRADFPS